MVFIVMAASLSKIEYQSEPISTLLGAISSGRLAHAYIFAGPEGVGKKMTAIAIGKLLLCENYKDIISSTSVSNSFSKVVLDSCNVCNSCKLVDAETHPDVHIIYKELIWTLTGKKSSKAIDLGIDLIRAELVERALIKPYLGRVKIFIIEEADRMTVQAQNATLKIIEEPPEDTYIFLLTRFPLSLLSTIRSRAPILRFNTLPNEFIERITSRLTSDRSELEFIIRFSGGSAGLALRMLKAGLYGINSHLIKGFIECLKEGALPYKLAERSLELAESLAERLDSLSKESGIERSKSDLTREAIGIILTLVSYIFSDAIRLKLSLPQDKLLNTANLSHLRWLSGSLGIEDLRLAIGLIWHAQEQLNSNVNVNLLLTNLYNKLIFLLTSRRGLNGAGQKR